VATSSLNAALARAGPVAQGASGGSGGGGHGTSVLAEENRSLKALLLATEEQCARLSAASYYARGAGIQQERDVRLASL